MNISESAEIGLLLSKTNFMDFNSYVLKQHFPLAVAFAAITTDIFFVLQ